MICVMAFENRVCVLPSVYGEAIGRFSGSDSPAVEMPDASS